MTNHIHQPPASEPSPLRNGKSKSEQHIDMYCNSTGHENSAYLDDEDSFSEIHQGKRVITFQVWIKFQ